MRKRLVTIVVIVIATLASGSMLQGDGPKNKKECRVQQKEAIELMLKHKPTEALPVIQGLLEYSPENAYINMLAGIAYYALDSNERAEGHLRTAAKNVAYLAKDSKFEDRATPETFYFLAKIYERYGEYDKAVLMYGAFLSHTKGNNRKRIENLMDECGKQFNSNLSE